jgi:hypothetical protein
MSKNFKQAIFLFAVLAIGITTPLLLFPINIFPGVIEINNGLQQLSYDVPLSLSYFIGRGFNEGDLDNVSVFYLKPASYFLVFIFTLAMPAMIAFRYYLYHEKKKK